jgi:hypothetical protein
MEIITLLMLPKIKKELIILPNIEDILFLFGNKNTRGKNDETNKVREDIIEKLPFIEDEYYTNLIFGEKWRYLKEKFNDILSSICKSEYENIKIKKMAGRNNNYDFNITFLDNNKNIVQKSNIEFKYNSNNLCKLPQFLSLNIHSNILEKSYAEFYYDNYIDKYTSIDPSINVEKPSKDLYLKQITSVNYSVNPFFQRLYDSEENLKKEKFDVVNESIKEFLNIYGSSINTSYLTEKFLSTQDQKFYLLWDCVDFHLEQLRGDELQVNKFVNIHKNNTIIVASEKYNFKLLLRWRNHKGILNPAWQISLEKIK